MWGCWAAHNSSRVRKGLWEDLKFKQSQCRPALEQPLTSLSMMYRWIADAVGQLHSRARGVFPWQPQVCSDVQRFTKLATHSPCVLSEGCGKKKESKKKE